MQSKAIRSQLTWALLVALIVLPAGAHAGDGQECSISKTTKELAQCEACLAWKELVSSAEGASIDLEVHELMSGVIVEISGSTPAAVQVIHDVVDELWCIGAAEASKGDHVCEGCVKRNAKLAKAIRDRTITDEGVMVVLTSVDAKMVEWLRSDARQTEEWILSLR